MLNDRKIGALCCDDYKGINNQFVEQGKVVVVENIRGTPIRSLERNAESRTTKAFWRNLWGGTESIVEEEKANVVYAVRRLTLLEEERLQGLPDNFTLIEDKSCSDSARYKALGNGMAQPVADWVLKRLVEAVNENTES